MSENGKSRVDCIVLLSILILLAAGDLLSHGALGIRIVNYGLKPTSLQYFGAIVLSFLVGFAELVARYRDEPWRVAMLPT